MRHVDGLYTQRFNRSHRRDGTLFRGRYKAILVEQSEYLAVVIRYIHLNAVDVPPEPTETTMGLSSSRKGIDNFPGPTILLGPEKHSGVCIS